MNARITAGGALPLERRAMPALGVGVSLAFHAVLAASSLPLFRTGRPASPKLIAARDVLAVSIERAPPPSKRAEEERPTARRRRTVPTEIARREEAPSPDQARPVLDPARIERVRAPTSEHVPGPRPVRGPASREAPGGVRAARLISGDAKPRYPARCRGGAHRPGGCEGTGAYEVEIDEAGRVLSAKVLRSAGCRELDRAAVRFLLRRASFAPAEMDGLAVPWKGRLAFRFRLEDAGDVSPGRGGKR